MFPEPLTPCQCESAGFCQRHQCEKPFQWVLRCRLNACAFERWENGEGPCLDQMRAELGRRFPDQKPFAELPPCRHRSVEQIDSVECELCGGRTEWVPVFSCAVFGRCTTRRYGSRTAAMRSMPACIRCDAYSAVEFDEPGAELADNHDIPESPAKLAANDAAIGDIKPLNPGHDEMTHDVGGH